MFITIFKIIIKYYIIIVEKLENIPSHQCLLFY